MSNIPENHKKKILYISQLYPYPANSGGKIKTLNTLLALVKKYQVFAIFISEENPIQKDLAYLEKRGIQVKVFFSPTILASVKDDLVGLFFKFIHGIPHYVFQYTHDEAFPYIKKAIIEYNPDIIHIDHLNMSQYLPKHKKRVWILEHHNVEAYLYFTRFISTRKVTRKFYLFIEMVLTYFYESKMLRKFDHIFTISLPEEKRVKNMYGVSRVSTQPIVSTVRPIKKVLHSNPRIGFVGTMGWPPNEDAIEWFLKDIFPKIKAKIPDAQFHLAGKPGVRYIPKGEAGIYFHGFLANIDPLLARIDVFVLPFRMGGGLRLKALTALSAGIPLVTTSLGIEGLNVQNGKQCLIANNAQDFADNVVKLIESKKLRNELSGNALRYITIHHDGKKNGVFLEEYLRFT